MQSLSRGRLVSTPSLKLGLMVLALMAIGGEALAQNAPYARGGQGSYSQGVDKATLEKLTKQQKAAEAAFKKKPKDAAAKKAYIDATNRHGLACMTTDAIDRKVKYKMALADFRKVLKVDPKNKIAKDNHDLIVSIYKSMGRPVPG